MMMAWTLSAKILSCVADKWKTSTSHFAQVVNEFDDSLSSISLYMLITTASLALLSQQIVHLQL